MIIKIKDNTKGNCRKKCNDGINLNVKCMNSLLK